MRLRNVEKTFKAFVGKSKDQTRIVKQIEKMKIPTPR
jgi:hypothetical protein